MNKLEGKYRDWLVDQVNVVENLDYGPLLRKLFNVEFYWLIPNDEDRAMDGKALREDFMDEFPELFRGEERFDLGPARVLEVLIGIAKRIEFQLFGGRYMDEWTYEKVFWDMIWNLGLEDYSVTLLGSDCDRIDEIVTVFLDRKYKCHKKGNIFYIENYGRNLTKTNIWAQMMMYIREKWPLEG